MNIEHSKSHGNVEPALRVSSHAARHKSTGRYFWWMDNVSG